MFIIAAESFVLNAVCFAHKGVPEEMKCIIFFFLQPIPAPSGPPTVQVEGYWVSQGEMEPALDPSYILTTSVKLNLRDLARVVSAG